jgi:hypothetical protein
VLLLDKLRAARSLQILPPAVRTGNQVKGACYVARRRHEGGGARSSCWGWDAAARVGEGQRPHRGATRVEGGGKGGRGGT